MSQPLVNIYDQQFNQNEWFTIILLIIGIILVWKLKDRFSKKELITYLLYSVFIGMFFDHTISIVPFDYYDVNDLTLYEFMDFITYLMYGPFGYLYIYIFDRFKVKTKYAPIYILLWALVSVTMEHIARGFGVYHYKNGYQIYYSFPIYLFTLTSNLCLYKFLQSKKISNQICKK